MNLENTYQMLCDTSSDINEHLPTLKRYAEECDHITEFGVRYIVSTYAFLAGRPKRMISYDIMNIPWKHLLDLAEGYTDFEFRLGNTLEIDIEETDLLFIDTLHNYDQLSKELELHGNKARKYLIFHDTTTYEYVGEAYDGFNRRGIWPAIQNFLDTNPEWTLHERYTNNNGLTILKRKSPN